MTFRGGSARFASRPLGGAEVGGAVLKVRPLAACDQSLADIMVRWWTVPAALVLLAGECTKVTPRSRLPPRRRDSKLRTSWLRDPLPPPPGGRHAAGKFLEWASALV